jgi:phosphatidylinositol glycan class A protein
VKKIPCDTFYSELAEIYNWRQVAERTEKVYDFAMTRPTPNLMSNLKTSLSWGSVAGILALFYTVMETLVIFLMEMIFPSQEIDILPSFNQRDYNENIEEFGDHQFLMKASVEDLNKDKTNKIIKFEERRAE